MPSCNHCEPHGWRRICCGMCGAGHQAFVVVMIATEDPAEDAQYPYTETAMCKKCWTPTA